MIRNIVFDMGGVLIHYNPARFIDLLALEGGDRDLLRVSLYVPDRAQAQLAEERFYQNPDRVYRLVLAALTGDLEYAEELLR